MTWNRKLALAQGERVENLVNYNHYIEQLYRDIRTIKHDSENILISLKDSIDSGNRKEIKEVYNAVVKESAYAMFSPEVGFGALGNIKKLLFEVSCNQNYWKLRIMALPYILKFQMKLIICL
ncbi:hypothetical protein ACR31S_06355 [Streptococcus iniae]